MTLRVSDTITFPQKSGQLELHNHLANGSTNTSKFKFDKVFSDTDDQESVFRSVQGVVKSALDGHNVCIFAYGQTGSGKTFTMQGPEGANVRDRTEVEERGIVPRAVQMIFDTLEQRKTYGKQVSFSVTMSCFEIYIETVRDLLKPENTMN